MAKAVFGSSVLLPIPNALLVTVWQGPASGQSPPGRKPVWLFDFVTSKMFGEGSTGTRGYMNLMEAGTCFDEVHMPVPSRGTFDAMAVDLKGRWGTGDFYKTVSAGASARERSERKRRRLFGRERTRAKRARETGVVRARSHAIEANAREGCCLGARGCCRGTRPLLLPASLSQ
jgi:hypothetical protein